jgi:hypothetical protein
MEASPAIQQKFKLALQEFLNEPTTPTMEFHQILQALKAKAAAPPPPPVIPPPTSTAVTPSSVGAKDNSKKSTITTAAAAVAPPPVVDENEERKNRMIKSIDTRVERKRRDLHERYRKRMYDIPSPLAIVCLCD